MKHSNGTPHTTAEPRKAPPPLGRPPKRAASNGADLETDRIDERKLLEVLTALRKGNFAPRLPVKWTGAAGKIADTVNDVMETNQRMAREVERLARVVGKEGKINHRASVSDFAGQWAASIDSVNTLVLLH